ncbi:unnamed protein product [Periconia digitata]|uniref:Uncharacterized protein n=1 Tax=Periconia digitata TaxID=1303443 RepID=A0A9W4XJR3_9PLEO|nr:unnamed protein product [Periconia digitata]
MPPKASKPAFKSTIPFTETQWPVITPDVRDNIVDLLCHLLQPLGDHRRTHIIPSKGKKSRTKKRKRSTKDQNEQHHSSSDPSTKSNPKNDSSDDLNQPLPPPPPPEISSHILIGLNSITRHLEALLPPQTQPQAQPTAKETPEQPKLRPFAQIILLTTSPANPSLSLPHAHIPPLLSLSSSSNAKQQTQILSLPLNPSEPRLSSALHIPHIAALGILEGAPGTEALINYVRENVEGGGVVECKWVKEAMEGRWLGGKIVS